MNRLSLAAILLAAAAPLAAQSVANHAAPVTIAAVTAADVAMPSAPAAAPDSAVPPASSPRSAIDPDSTVVTYVPGPSNELPAGTLLKVRLDQTISTRSTANGTPFTATFEEPVMRDGKVIIPSGAQLHGTVVDITNGPRIFGRASFRLDSLQIVLPDGSHYVLHAQIIDTDQGHTTKVSRKGTVIAPDHASSLAILSLTTASAASAGAVFGGLPGALIGAGAGAGISTAQWLRHDREAAVPVESKLIFSLTTPMPIIPLH
jgi:hypothetical protein